MDEDLMKRFHISWNELLDQEYILVNEDKMTIGLSKQEAEYSALSHKFI